MKTELFDLAARSPSSPAAMAASGSAWRGAWRTPAPRSRSSAATRRSRTPRSPSSRHRRQGNLRRHRRHRQGRRRRHGRARQRELGRIDILVNNAGINIRKPPHALELAEWNSVIDDQPHQRLPVLAGGLSRDEGGRRRQDHQYRLDDVDLRRQLRAGLAASKGGIVQFTRSCACAWAADNIQANAVLPGWIDTDLTKRAREEIDGLHDKVLARTPAARWGEIDDFAGIAVFLASPPRISSPAPRSPSTAAFRSWDARGIRASPSWSTRGIRTGRSLPLSAGRS